MLHLNRMPYRRLAVMLLAAVMLIALIAGCGKRDNEGQGAPGSDEGNVIATYKGGQVTDVEFDKYAALLQIVSPEQAMYISIPQFKEQMVTQYITTNALIGQASKEQRADADKEADEFKAQLEKALKTQKELKDHMDQSKLSVNDARSIYSNMLTIQKFATGKIEELKGKVTEDEVKAEFKENPTQFNTVTLRHILIGTVDPQTQKQLHTDEEALKIAKEVKGKLESGGDWKQLAKQYSTDDGSKENGGLYDKQSPDNWVPEFKEAANTQEIGKIGEPVKTEYGYHVIKVESRETVTGYEALKPEQKDQLKQGVSAKKLDEFITAEQDKLDIKVTLPEEPAPTAPAAPSPSPSAAPASPEATAK